MANLLFSNDNLSSYIYFTSGENIVAISKNTGVPVFDIIADNNLKREPSPGTPLLIKKRAKTKMLYPDDFTDKEKIQALKSFNKVDLLFPFMIVKIP